MAQLLPPSVQGLYAGESSTIYRYVTLVRESLDLSEIERQIQEQFRPGSILTYLLVQAVREGHQEVALIS
jgi:hypothetical protein